MVKKAFTLVELLVVISVVALLMAILMPALSRAKQESQSIVCLNNLRQMLLAANVYANENDGFYPSAYYNKTVNGIKTRYCWDFSTTKDWSTTPATVKVRPGILWDGKTIEKIHQCPAFKGKSNTANDPYTGYNYNTSYIGRDETQSPRPPDNAIPSAKVLEVGQPDRTAIFGDGQYTEGANKFMRAPFSNPRDASFSGRWAGTQGYRHNGKTNVAFCDGHVQSWKELYSETYPSDKQIIDEYNSGRSIKVGFLSEDNSLYDLE